MRSALQSCNIAPDILGQNRSGLPLRNSKSQFGTEKIDLDDNVDHWLKQYARFDRERDDLRRLGFRSRSLCFITGGESVRLDDWADTEEASIWRQNCKAMGAIIQDLPEDQRMAISIVYLGIRNTPRHTEDALIGLLQTAEPALIAAMRKKNVI